MEGWIKLHRIILDWDWYDDANTFRLFIHLLLKANVNDNSWRGNLIKRGQLFTSIEHLSNELNLTTKQIRNSLAKLNKTQEIEQKGANNGTMISICKYDSYQSNTETTGQTRGKRRANEWQTKGNNIRSKEEIDEEEEKEFNNFWNLYNKKVGDKESCKAKFIKLNEIDKKKIFDTLPLFLANIKDKQFQPMPYTYLHQKRWNDELNIILPTQPTEPKKTRPEFVR